MAACAAVLIGLLSVGCGDDGDGEETADVPTETSEAADDLETWCEGAQELGEIRGEVYGQPFDETPEEIEATLAEAGALQAELAPLIPEEIREAVEFHEAEFMAPVDEQIEAAGWDPLAAMNSAVALAIFEDPEINAATDEITAFMEENCGTPAPPE